MQVAETKLAETIETAAGSGDARRTRAHGRALRHSARVRLLRRIIPVAAGSAMLVVAAIVLNPFSGSLPSIGLGPVSVSGTKVTMEHPRLSGFRKGERGYEVTASAALQDVRKPTLIELQGMKGRIDTDDKGGLAHMEAKAGLFDSAKEALSLRDDIRIWTDKGEEIRLNSAAIDFKAGSVQSPESVTVTVPNGSLTADSLDVVENGRVISFVGNVHAAFQAPSSKDAGEGGERIRTSSAEAAR